VSQTERAEFARQVQSALSNLHDPVFLQTHPLAPHARASRTLSRTSTGRALRQALLEAIASLRPPGERASDERSTRRYRVLQARYEQGLDPEEARAKLGIGKSLFYAEHKLAVDALVAALAERWGVGSPDEAFAGDVGPVDAGGATAVVDPLLSTLPAAITSFVGREREKKAVLELLGLAQGRGDKREVRADGVGPVRLLTLLGPAGAGKTRLALEVGGVVAATSPDLPVCFVDLAPLAEATLVFGAVAHALGLREAAGEASIDMVRRYLTGRRLLLILDNFEHVRDAAPNVGALLRAAPDVCVLTTSRTALRVYGEWEFPVEPLALPEVGEHADRIQESPAVRLFVERARAVRADFRLDEGSAPFVADIVRRLDGLPLAIELAAAQVRLLAPAELAARLQRRLSLLANGPRDVPARQRTLEAAIAWSYRLLEPAQQALFRRLAVFAGGASLTAISGVCADGSDAAEDDETKVLTALDALAAHSLVSLQPGTSGAARTTMLETIRDYAADQLAQAGEERAARDRHAAYFVSLAELAEPRLGGPEQGAWLQRLDDEYANLRAAVRWLNETRQSDAGLRLVAALRQYWLLYGHWSEGRAWLTDLLARSRGELSEARAKALYLAGSLAGFQSDHTLSKTFYEEGLSLWRALGGLAGEARCLMGLGNAAVGEGDLARARDHHEQGLAILRRTDDQRGIASILSQLGIIHYLEGEYTAAERVLHESLALRRALGDPSSVAHSLNLLGTVARCARDLDAAAGYLEEGLRLCDELGHQLGRATILLNVALVALERGEDLSRVATPLTQSLSLYAELGDRRGEALCIEVSGLALEADDPAHAAELLAVGDVLVRASGARRPPTDTALVRAAAARLRARMGDGEFARVASRGASVGAADAAALARSAMDAALKAAVKPSLRNA
jgi:predicted ATPase